MSEIRTKLTICVNSKLLQHAKNNGINLSRLMDEAIVYELGRIQEFKRLTK
jgi:post-segregation antitoxin (ccd killing protein)